MMLLIDNNLSHKLCAPLQIYFTGTKHVRDVLIVEAEDESIWNYANEHGYVILTNDNDFSERSLLKGCPPKVIHLLCGNKSTKQIIHLLLENVEQLSKFVFSSPDCLLKIY